MTAPSPNTRCASFCLTAPAALGPDVRGHAPDQASVHEGRTKAIDRVRGICLALPEMAEKLAWGESAFRAGKVFAMVDSRHVAPETVQLRRDCP
jgi:hypothetical protein